MTINLQMHNKVAGEYKLVIRRGEKVVQETGWFDNLVLNQGLDALYTAGGQVFSYCKLGTGVSTPVETQTALDAQLVSSTAGNSSATSAVNQGAADGYSCIYTFAWTFTQGAVVGNISEIGVGWAAAAGNLFSRALITDTFGNPISITLIAIDQLTVYYRVKVIPNLTESYGSFSINGTSYNYTSKLCSAASFGASTLAFYYGWLGPWGMSFYGASPSYPTIQDVSASGPSGTQTGSGWSQGSSYGSAGNGTYVGGSYYIDATWTFGIQLANSTGGIAAIRASWGQSTAVFAYQIVLDRAIPKDTTNVLSLTTRISWGRI